MFGENTKIRMSTGYLLPMKHIKVGMSVVGILDDGLKNFEVRGVEEGFSSEWYSIRYQYEKSYWVKCTPETDIVRLDGTFAKPGQILIPAKTYCLNKDETEKEYVVGVKHMKQDLRSFKLNFDEQIILFVDRFPFGS